MPTFDCTRIHPLSTTAERLSTVADRVMIHTEQPDGPSWFSLAELLMSGVSPLDLALEQAQACYPTVDRKVLAHNLFDGIVWWVLLTVFSPLLIDRRVPTIVPETTMLHVHAEGHVDGVAFTPERFAALSNDPDVEHPDALIVPGFAALWLHAYRQIEAPWLPALIEAVCRRSSLTEKVLWLVVADRCTGLVLWINQKIGRQGACSGEVKALLARLPHCGTTGILRVECNGHCHLFVRRSSCCFRYTYPDHGYCRTCPKQPLAERLRLLREHMEESGII